MAYKLFDDEPCVCNICKSTTDLLNCGTYAICKICCEISNNFDSYYEHDMNTILYGSSNSEQNVNSEYSYDSNIWTVDYIEREMMLNEISEHYGTNYLALPAYPIFSISDRVDDLPDSVKLCIKDIIEEMDEIDETNRIVIDGITTYKQYFNSDDDACIAECCLIT